MEIEFRDKSLALVESERFAETRLPIAVINSLRLKLRFLRNAPDERSIRNWRSLRYKKMNGEERSIRINDQYRLLFTIDTAVQPNKITVLEVWDHD